MSKKEIPSTEEIHSKRIIPVECRYCQRNATLENHFTMQKSVKNFLDQHTSQGVSSDRPTIPTIPLLPQRRRGHKNEGGESAGKFLNELSPLTRVTV